MGNSCFKPDNIVDNVITNHPLADQMHQFESLSPWVMVDDYCAMRYLKNDNPLRYGSRVAFVEKTARVLVDNDDNWESQYKSSEYGMSEESLRACDEKLIQLGYV